MDVIDLLTGLVLAGAVLFAAGYVVRELAGDSLASFFAAHTAKTSEHPNNRLIGELGEVVDASGDGDLRVRVGIERWSARLADEDGATPPVGARIRVAAVDGPTLRVEHSPAD